MTDLSPAAFLRVYDDDKEFFGGVTYTGDALSYDLPGLVGNPGASFSGFQVDPTGAYLMQQMVPVAFDADPPQWRTATGAALPASFSFGTDPATGRKFLYHGSVTETFSAVLQAARVQDEGFYLDTYIGQTTAAAAVNLYIEFSFGRAAGETGLRLALEPTRPIRLQASYDDSQTWTDVASADALGECETYLTQNRRYLGLSVLAQTDQSWYDTLPTSLSGSGAPPNQIVITIGAGDAVLTFSAGSLAAGSLAIFGQNRQVSARPALMRFSTTGSAALPSQVRPVMFQSVPVVTLSGYAPDAGAGISGQCTADSPYSAGVTMTLAAQAGGAGIDSTGYALRSCFLASVDAEFPPVQVRPSINPSYVDYPLIYWDPLHWWDQTSGTVRHRAEVWLTNQNNEFAPGVGAALGVRAARLFTSRDGGATYAPEMTGWLAMEDGGQEWVQHGTLRFFKMSLSDRLVHTEEDTAICCGFQLPYDFQCQYYAFGQQAYRLGITDDWWQFPLVRRGDATPYYYLDGGTTQSPVHQFPPDMTLGESMGRIRAAGAEYDPATMAPLPMVMGTDALGNLIFQGLPVGVVSLLSDPALTLASTPTLVPEITFSQVPAINDDGSAQLNEFVEQWSSKTSLRRVRTPVVMVGLDPQTGSAVFGVAYNEKVGGGPYAESYAPGYIGVDKPLYIVSRQYSSPQVAALAAQNASIQLAAPAIDSGGQVHLQPGLMPLTVVAINDYASQGTVADVGYYLTMTRNRGDLRDPEHPRQATILSGRILGLSA